MEDTEQGLYDSIHHVGCAVRSIVETLTFYRELPGLTESTGIIEVEAQRVSVCFLRLASNVYLELIEASSEKSPIERYLSAGFYHLCFLTEDLSRECARLRAARCAPLPRFSSEAFDGRYCQFFVTPQQHLLEFAEISRQEFNHFFLKNQV